MFIRCQFQNKIILPKDYVKINAGDVYPAEFTLDVKNLKEQLKTNKEWLHEKNVEVIVEAYGLPQKEIFHLGPLEEIKEDVKDTMHSIYELHSLKFNFFLVKKEGNRSKVLASCIGRRPDNQRQDVLFHVQFSEELEKNQIWKLAFPNEDTEPVIWINAEHLGDIVDIEKEMKDPNFGGTIVPAAFELVLNFFFIESKNIDMEDEKIEQSILLADKFMKNQGYPQEQRKFPFEDEISYVPNWENEIIPERKKWIERAVGEYCAYKKWAEKLKKKMEKKEIKK